MWCWGLVPAWPSALILSNQCEVASTYLPPPYLWLNTGKRAQEADKGLSRWLATAYSESGDNSEMLWDVAERGVEGPSAEAVAEGVAVV